jgi:hypothetical protein
LTLLDVSRFNLSDDDATHIGVLLGNRHHERSIVLAIHEREVVKVVEERFAPRK